MKKAWLLVSLSLLLILLTGCACKHENTTLINAVPAECGKTGYSGDLYCNNCKETLEQGSVIAMLEHVPGELTGFVAPTCLSAGQSGSILCTLCGDEIKKNEEIAATGHVLGELYHAKHWGKQAQSLQIRYVPCDHRHCLRRYRNLTPVRNEIHP